MALHTLAAEGEKMTQRLEVQSRRFLNDQAFGHLEFQKQVMADLVQLSRMVRDLARASGTVEVSD